MDAFKTLLTLRAVRQFQDRPLPDEALTHILEAGRWTGSAKNVQAWAFIVVRNRSTLTDLATCGRYAGHLREAALAVVLVTEPNWAGTFDMGRVAQNMMLAAWTEGIGSCIASLHDGDRARELLEVPAGRQVTAISFGYPDAAVPPTIEGLPRDRVLATTGRKPMQELVHWEKW